MASRCAGRILCVTSSFPRWAGDSTTPFVLHLAQDLQSLGWQVDVLAPHAAGAALSETLAGLGVERFRYLWPSSLETVCYQGGALVNLRKRKGNALKLPALVAAEWLAVLWRLAARRYDLLHSHWILPQGLVGALSARPLRVPHVITVHGGDVFALRGRLLQGFKRLALGAAEAVTVNSSATETAVAGLHSGLRDCRRIPMGVAVRPIDRDSPSILSIRDRYRVGAGPLLVFVGRLVDEKGCADLLEAVRLLSADLADVSAMIIGEGQDRAELEARCRAAGVADRVAFLGWVAPEAVLDHIAAADVFVGPSRTGVDGWVEAQGLTLLEAMVAGTPVVASRLGGIGDSVRDGVTGLLVDERAPEQIAAVVRRLVADPDLWHRLARQARQTVETRFSREASAQAFDNLFAGLIDHRQRVRRSVGRR
ncbi:glycosyltransferase [Thioflavicoccus mobilis 8321]|uniref:Glycosyltransferase n=1 Tax=Thioflavicoccus mobilis 8321 TaxID=765912 RepID=L0GUB0_9GAMM|nr:glycosyltransferase family 4 protein [Thioflavicoccus mobilis]AGA88894.1 glycosyltransferase [Thioflavicoccus mobilis 8321]